MSKSEGKFIVFHDNQEMGPFSMEEIVSMVHGKQLSPLDYIYDESQQDWVSFMEHPELTRAIAAKKPKTPPKKTVYPKKNVSPNMHTENVNQEESLNRFMTYDWYILKGDNKFGPFAYMDIVKMLQEKNLFEFDFVWHKELPHWKRIAEIEAFSPENIKKLKTAHLPEIEQVFFRRRYKRVKFGGTILVHDNKKIWKGKGVEISAGGAAVIMENALLVPGQFVYLHFKPGDGVPPFNAICEVVSKKYMEDVATPDSPILYGVKFKDITPKTKAFLEEYANKKSSDKKVAA